MILLGTRGSTMKQTLVTALLWVSQDCRLHKYVAFALLHILPSLPTGMHTNAHSEMPPHHCAFMPYPCIDPLCPTWCPALGCFWASARELHGWAVGTVDEPAVGQAHWLSVPCLGRDSYIPSLIDKVGVLTPTLQGYCECVNGIVCVKQCRDCGLPTHCPNLFCFLSNRTLHFNFL